MKLVLLILLLCAPAAADGVHDHYFENSTLSSEYVDNFLNHRRFPCDVDCDVVYNTESRTLQLVVPTNIYNYFRFPHYQFVTDVQPL